MLQVSSKNHLYFNIFDYFQYESPLQIHAGAYKQQEKALITKAFFACLYTLDFKASSKKANLTKDSLFSFFILSYGKNDYPCHLVIDL